jgi:ribose transport system substrate-binding protein
MEAKMKKLYVVTAVAAILALVAVGCGTPATQPAVVVKETVVVQPTAVPPAAPKTGPLTIAFIVKSTTDPFWLRTIDGAKQRAADLNVDLKVFAPATEADVAEQVAIVEDAIQQKVDGIVLAPSDSNALAGAVKEANAAGIPVAVIDTAVVGADYLTFTATDNFKGAGLVADFIGQKLGGKGKVAALGCTQTVSTCRDLLTGFLASLEKYPDIKLVAAPMDVVPYQDKGYNATTDIITANPDLGAIFSFGGPANQGAVQAVKDSKASVVVVGRNASPEDLQDIKNGDMAASMAQFPDQMGAIGVQSIVDFFAGKSVPKFIDSGVDLVTLENLSKFLK